MKHLLCFLFIGINVLILASSALAVSYQVTDIASFDLRTEGIKVTGINKQGMMVGTITPFCGKPQAFIWSKNTGFNYLSALEGYEGSDALGINDKGQVVGYSYSSDSEARFRACLWEEGKPIVDIGGALPSGEITPLSQASAINNDGHVIGWYTSTPGTQHAFIWSKDTETKNLDENDSSAIFYPMDINDNDTVVGYGNDHAYIWDRTTGMRDIYVAGMPYIAPKNINNSGQVICQVLLDSTKDEQAFLWQEGHNLIPIGVLPNGSSNSSYATDINNQGIVVGRSNHQAFIWDNIKGIQALPSLSGCRSGIACCINDYGEIGGYFIDNTEKMHLVLWTPVPEPSSILALVGGIAGLSGFALKRRRS